jgi:hypothetical protein
MIDALSSEELRKIPLSENTLRGRISDISEEFCELLISELEASLSVLQAGEVTDTDKVHIIYLCSVCAGK